MARRQELVATYLAELPAARGHAAAKAFATGQSIGTWLPVPGITAEMRRRHGARVIEIRTGAGESVAGEPVGDRAVVRIGFPVENFGPQFPMLLTTVVGNDPSTSLTARLVDLHLPLPFRAAFPGPRLGVAGWRALTGVQGRPLLLNMIKPCTGFAPEVGADLAEQVARGGVDLIKDDELLADPAFNRVAERSRAYRARLERVAADTGHRARYIANVTDRAVRLVDTARSAIEAGADAVMANALVVGLDAFQSLVEADLGVPILAHTTAADVFTGAASSGVGQAVLLGKMLRLAGADGVFVPAPIGPSRPWPIYEQTVRWLLDEEPGTLPVMPMIAGGVTGAMIPALVERAGIDVMLGIGGAIQGHPEGAEAGARAMRAAIDAALASRRTAAGAAPAG